MTALTKVCAEVRTPYGAHVRMRAAKQEVEERFSIAWQKLLADKEAELRAIDEKFWRGGFA